MNTPLCVGPNCGSLPHGAQSRRIATHGLRLCTGCYRELKGNLVELPEIYDDCQPTPLPRGNPVVQRVSGTRQTSGILLDEGAIAIRSRILGLLASWAALVADERAITKLPRRRPTELVTFLVKNLSWLLAHPVAASFAEEVYLTTTDARGSVGAQQCPSVDLGRCIHPGCDAKMTTGPSTRNAKPTREVRCAAGHTWLPHQWLQLLHQIRQIDRTRGTTDPQHSGDTT
jgi:hypothetical protein